MARDTQPQLTSPPMRAWFRRHLSLPWRRSLQVRLVTIFLGLSATTFLAVSFVSYDRATAALRGRLEDQLAGVADVNASDVETWVQSQVAILRYAASSHTLADGAAQLGRAPADAAPGAHGGILAALQALRAGRLLATEVQLLSVPGGRVEVSTDPGSEGLYSAEDLYYLRGSTGTYTQNIYPSATTSRPTLTIATPVMGRTGSAVAVLVAHLELQKLEAVLRGRSGAVPIQVYLVNKTKEFVSAERFGRAGYLRGVNSHGIDRALARENGVGSYIDYSGVAVVGAWRWLPARELALLVEAPQSEAFAPAQRLLAINLAATLLGLAALTVGLIATVRRVTQPILGTAAAAERVAQGDFEARAPVTTEDEVGRLARTFNVMAAQLRTLVDQLHGQVSNTNAALGEAQASRSLLQDIVDNTSTMVFVVGLEGELRLANERFERVFGVSRSTALGRPLAEVLDDGFAPGLLSAIADARMHDSIVERELVVQAEPDPHTWLAVCFPLRNEAGLAYSVGVIGTDLTERARQEEERRHLDATVQHAQKLESLGIMAGGIAHDFNNILGAVMGNADLAMHSLQEPDEVRDALEQIIAATRRASELTRQMLAYAGKSSFRREVVDLNVVAADIVSLVRVAQSKKVHFELAPAPQPLWIESDIAQLSQVILNLVTNAAEAIGDAEGSVSVTTRAASQSSVAEDAHAAAGNPAWVHLIVSDTGVGMDAATQQRIFEPFFSTKQSGRGLGLAAVTGIVRSAGGTLSVESTPGLGTTFDVFLPVAPSPNVPTREVEPLQKRGERATVLVVDDEAVLRRVCRRALERAGYAVLEAADGYEAVTTFEAHREQINAIVLDLTMPGMNGAEALAAVRLLRGDLPVIIASGYDASDAMANIPQDGHLRFLQKPFGTEMLVRVVGEILEPV